MPKPVKKQTKVTKPYKAQGTKKKVSSGPKRPLSTFLLFSQEERANVKQQNPNMNGKEVVSELGQRWRALPENDKKRFRETYVKNKAEFEVKTTGDSQASSSHPVAEKAKKAKTKNNKIELEIEEDEVEVEEAEEEEEETE
ncbi:hypothetical protein BGZ65_001833 [Modicella reniformis]|uniref:HMG box domain-containing protein n=1 Tax=Modicella reniformis TaxID=1440133 RepID=A0A9P6J1F2_9FUNG|nr:hypothetical protein BGZ65_001833 [Modicella reniformis]